MPSPYRSSVAYRGQSFVAVTAPKGVNIKGVMKGSAGLTLAEKKGLQNALYQWKREGEEENPSKQEKS